MFKISRALLGLRNRLQPIHNRLNNFYISTRLTSQFSVETISLTDQRLFPTEEGPVINSTYGHKFESPKCRIDQFVWADMNRWQNKAAVVCGVTGRSYTYAQLRDNCAALAINLRTTLKLNESDVVGVCMFNSPEYIIASLGVIEAGLILSTFNPNHTAQEIAEQIKSSNARAMICTTDLYEQVKRACELIRYEVQIICIPSDHGVLPSRTIHFNELIDFKAVRSRSFQPVESTYNDLGFLPYSSGTTGLPKGVMLTHRNIISNCMVMRGTYGDSTVVVETTDTTQDVFLVILPLFHIYAFTVNFIACLAQGCKLVTLPAFKPDTFLDAILKYKPSIINLVPPIVVFYGKSDLVKPDHGKSLRIVSSGAAPLAAEDVERFWDKAPHVQFMQGYGLTETSPVTHMTAVGSTNYASIGGPVYGTQAKVVSIEDPAHPSLGPNQSGEIWVRGPQVMKGYLNNEKETNETLLPGGWLRTGDIGHYDENHEFYITDRYKELIKVKGAQVAPAELEGVLREHPAVADAAVIGVPDERSGEVPKGIVILKPDMKVDKKSIIDFVAGKVAKYKQLKSLEIVDSIPKTATGKILRRELKKIYVK